MRTSRLVSRALFGALWVLAVSCRSEAWPAAPSDGGPRHVLGLSAALESPVVVAVGTSGDTALKQGSPNQNFGGDLVLRLQSSGRNRGVVLFESAEIAQAVGTGTLLSAALTLDIDNAGNNWGTGRTIGAHRLTQPTAEYNATWACSIDTNIYNSATDCSGTTAWTMWSNSNPSLHPWVEPATSLSTITSGQTGSVSFDVTTDVAGYLDGTLENRGWLLKKEDEGASGLIDFMSKERGASVGPRLLLTVQPADPPVAGASGGSSDAGPPTTTVLIAVADTYLRKGSPNQNYGAELLTRVKASGRNRALVAFDSASIQSTLNGHGLYGATLELTIAETHPNWGPDRALGAHSLKQAWTESGATWNCAWDHDTTNSSEDCTGDDDWTMWGASETGVPWFDPPKATAVVSSSQTGVLTFDVTRDLACYLAGYHTLVGAWMIKKELESQAGWIKFASRETATPPRLLVSVGSGPGVQVTAVDCNGSGEPPSCVPTAILDDDCDDVDDDCDGTPDDDYLVSDTSCGVGACAATGELSCVSGVTQDDCGPGAPAASDATCDGVDDDCSGQSDEDYVPVATTCGVGACAASGDTSCVSGDVVDGCQEGTPASSDTTCDGVDDDCNGQVDEDYAPVATSCGVGACAAAGTLSCASGATQDSCAPGTAAASDATCDGVDDDCSGQSDEDYVSLVTTCGVGACVAPGHTSCAAGQVLDSCQAGEPEAADDTCDGLDDDCDGQVDEDYVSQATSCGLGACVSAGATSCVDATVIDSCAPAAPATGDATCDGVDDDCDGQSDEDYAAVATTCGVGACVAAGSTSCAGGQVLDSCQPGAAASTDDTCDGIDDDCDGRVDQGYESLTTACGVGACAGEGATSCVNAQILDSCVVGAPAASDASCDGVDDDCDGQSDEDYAPVATTCGLGVCAATGATSCAGGVAVDSCAPGTPAALDASCDGLDDDCDGQVDDDFVTHCVGDQVVACDAGHSTLTACSRR